MNNGRRMVAGDDSRIQKMREYEDKLAKMTTATKENKSLANVAAFEARTDNKIRSNLVQQRMEALKYRREADLDGRRRLLADKLYAEDMSFKTELITLQETPEQRRAKLAARARQLASAREAERSEKAGRLLEQHFQENCDVLRATNAKRLLYRTIEERNAQIEQRMATRILEEEEARMFAEMNETERLKAEHRYLDEMKKKRAARTEMVSALNTQVKEVEARKREEAMVKQQEMAELRALWDQIHKEQEEADAGERDKMRRLAAELQEFNRLKQMEISEAERFERELDLKYLQEALALEATDEAREATARDQRREAMRRYRQQLAQMMQDDAENNAVKDALIEKTFLEQQAKQDAEIAAREEARRKLMAEVDAIRKQQIAERQSRRDNAYAEMLKDRQRLEDEERRAQDADSKKKIAAKRVALERALQLQTQIVAHAHQRATEEDSKLSELETAALAETAYISQVRHTLATTEPPRWHGRKKIEWN